MELFGNYVQRDTSLFRSLAAEVRSIFNSSTETFEVACSGCYARLRLTRPFEPAKWPRCPKCSSFVKLKTIILKSAPARLAFVFSAVLFLVGLLPVLWPAGLYLILAALIFFVLAISKFAASLVGWEQSSHIRRFLAFTSLKSLRDTSACVIAGLLIICAAQLLLKTVLSMSDEQSVKAVELLVIRQQDFLREHLKLAWTIIAFVVLLLFQAILPTVRVTHFKTVLTWASRVLTILTVIAAFSFFTEPTTAALERDWIAQRKPELNKSLGRVKKARQTLVTNAYLQAQIEAIPPEKKQQLHAYFVDAAKYAGHDESIQWLTDQLKNRPVDFSNATNEEPDFSADVDGSSNPAANDKPAELVDSDAAVEGAINRTEKWVSAAGTERVAPPSIEDARILEAEANRVETLSYASNTLVEQALKNAIDAHLSADLEPFIKLFVKQLEDSAVKSTVKFIPARIRSFQRAKSWVQRNVFAHNFQADWNWQVPSYAQYQKAIEPPPVAPTPEPTTSGEDFVGDEVVSDEWFEAEMHDLQCWIEENRLRAANELREAGPRLSRSQIDQLVDRLNSSETRIRLDASGQYRDLPPLSYYSARALEGMTSERLSSAERVRAHEIFEQYKVQRNLTRASTREQVQASICWKL